MIEEPIEKIIFNLSSFLASSLNSLGTYRYGVDEDDLLQEIRIRIWKAYVKREGDIRFFNAYIKKIVFSVFINEIHRIKKENKVLESGKIVFCKAEHFEDDNSSSSEILKTSIVNALQSLKGEQRQVIKLRLEGFGVGEIAKLKSWPYSKACNVLYRGMNKMKQKMREEGFGYED